LFYQLPVFVCDYGFYHLANEIVYKSLINALGAFWIPSYYFNIQSPINEWIAQRIIYNDATTL